MPRIWLRRPDHMSAMSAGDDGWCSRCRWSTVELQVSVKKNEQRKVRGTLNEASRPASPGETRRRARESGGVRKRESVCVCVKSGKLVAITWKPAEEKVTKGRGGHDDGRSAEHARSRSRGRNVEAACAANQAQVRNEECPRLFFEPPVSDPEMEELCLLCCDGRPRCQPRDARFKPCCIGSKKIVVPPSFCIHCLIDVSLDILFCLWDAGRA